MLFTRWSEEKAVEAYNLRLAGMTAQQIANSWGVTRNAIIGLTWRARKQLGLPPLPTRDAHPTQAQEGQAAEGCRAVEDPESPTGCPRPPA
jgi:hypothetical protein